MSLSAARSERPPCSGGGRLAACAARSACRERCAGAAMSMLPLRALPCREGCREGGPSSLPAHVDGACRRSSVFSETSEHPVRVASAFAASPAAALGVRCTYHPSTTAPSTKAPLKDRTSNDVMGCHC